MVAWETLTDKKDKNTKKDKNMGKTHKPRSGYSDAEFESYADYKIRERDRKNAITFLVIGSIAIAIMAVKVYIAANPPH